MIDREPQAPSAGNDVRTVETPHYMRWLAAVGPVAGLVLLIAVGFVLHRELGGHHLHDVLNHLRAIAGQTIGTAALLTAASYWLLGSFDLLALRYIGKQIAYPRVAFTAFVSYAFGHNLGVATLTGGAIRYRMYSVAGLSTTDVATVAGFCTLTSAIGLTALIGAALLLEPQRLAAALHISPTIALGIGALALLLLFAYAAWAAHAGRTLTIRGWSLQSPGASIALPQLALGIIDVALAASVLWVLLPPSADLSLPAFAGLYAMASSAGLISHVPGGLGVFESVIVVSLPSTPRDELLGALLAYRAIYYLLPLLCAAVLFGYREFGAQRGRLSQAEVAAAAWIAPVIPQVAGSLALVAGLLLLISGATVAHGSRLDQFRNWLPLPVLEVSHLAGSVAGLGLVVVAQALFRRSRAAHHLIMWLLAAGIVASILKGLDFEEAFSLSIISAVIWLGRRSFYRPASIIRERFTPAWTATLIALVGLTAWIGFLSHRNVAYSNELWWTFALDADAPRMLRALLVVSLGAAGILFANLLGSPTIASGRASEQDLDRARLVIAESPNSLANGALIGDKRLLFNDSGKGFVMYQVTGRSWVALGDPVGTREVQEELAWRFHELTDREGGWTIFYQATALRLPLYVDLGLTAMKIGEEARVALRDFSLEGSARAELRHARSRAQRDGASFEILAPGQAGALLPELRQVSQQWLHDKSTGEKRFSVGRFAPEYLAQFPLAIVRREGRPVAFANVWTSGTHTEFSVDLMRFGTGAPRSAMDYLFIELMLWGRSQGYESFSLGMAPLAGLATHPLAPAWNRVGNFVFRHGEHFYNFEGLRHYKAKFLPSWEARYLITPGGLTVPRVLAGISLMISGGIRQMVRK